MSHKGGVEAGIQTMKRKAIEMKVGVQAQATVIIQVVRPS